jgi:PhnB protein
MAVKPIPDGYHSLTPYLVVKNGADQITFLERAFGAKELHRSSRPDGSIMHAELQIGDSRLMMSEANAQWGVLTMALYMYVPDTDATYKRALEAGATSIMEPADQFYGDRNAGVKDSSGNLWWIGTHIEDVSAEEIERRAAAARPHAGTSA